MERWWREEEDVGRNEMVEMRYGRLGLWKIRGMGSTYYSAHIYREVQSTVVEAVVVVRCEVGLNSLCLGVRKFQ